MKVILPANDLRAAVVTTARACGKASIGAILPYLLIEADVDGAVLVSGTDTRLRASQALQGAVEEPGSICLPHTVLESVLDAVGDHDIALSVATGHKARLVAGATSVRAAGLNPEEFPAAATFERAKSVELSAAVLRALVGSVEHAATKDAYCPELQAIRIRSDGERVTMTAADGLALAQRSEEAQGDAFETLAPAAALDTIAGSLPKGALTVTLALSESGGRLAVSAEAAFWSLLTVDAQYPSVDQILSMEALTTYMVSRAELLRACKLMSVAAVTVQVQHQTYQVSRVTISERAEGLALVAGDEQADSAAQTVIGAERVGATSPAFTLDTTALRKAVERLPERIAIDFCGPTKPLIFRECDDAQRRHVQVIQQIAMSRREA